MKVHAFKVEMDQRSVRLENVMATIAGQTELRERIRLINQVEMRADGIDFRDNLWLLDFVRMRTSRGPGKVGRNSTVEGFPFGDGEVFGEETAALFDPTSGYILVEYNQFGVRAGVIADYLSAYVSNQTNLYTFNPKYDNSVEDRLLNQGITRKIGFTLDVSKMSEQDRQRGTALSEAIQYGRGAGADKIRVEISVSRDKSSGLFPAAREHITALRSILGQNPDAVTRLEVSGKANRDAVTEVLDLIGHRLAIEFKDMKVGADLRLARTDRWNALIRAKNGWSGILKA